jgi:predicted acetyltransferase
MDIEIRSITGEEFAAYCRAVELAFSGVYSDAEIEADRQVVEPERWFAAFEDGRIVGGNGAFSFRTTVPGGESVPTGAVTAVGVLPTHRRRGIGTDLMRTQLADIAARGEPIASLYASEGSIYGRYGFGLATRHAGSTIDADRAVFVRGYEPLGRTVLLDREAFLPLALDVYERARVRTPGMIAMDERHLAWRFADPRGTPEEPPFFAVHMDGEGRPDAYASYKVKHEWPDSVPRLALSVRELVAATPQGRADMWRFLFAIDLVSTVSYWNHPIDDPLQWLMAEPRRLRLRIADGLWVRLVDLPEALEARAYDQDGLLVVEVEDRFLPSNAGRWAIEVRDGTASVERTETPADLALNVNDLGAVYLGGTRMRTLAEALQLRELRDGALDRADAMFRWPVAPWSSFLF